MNYFLNNLEPLMLEQYRSAPNIQKWLDIFGGQASDFLDAVSEFKDSAFKLDVNWFEDSSAPKSYGKQLDLIGQLLKIPRNGMDDEEYRMALKGRAFLFGKQNIPTLISRVKQMSNSNTVVYYPQYPAGFILIYDGKNLTLEQLNSLVPAGVGAFNAAYLVNKPKDKSFVTPKDYAANPFKYIIVKQGTIVGAGETHHITFHLGVLNAPNITIEVSWGVTTSVLHGNDAVFEAINGFTYDYKVTASGYTPATGRFTATGDQTIVVNLDVITGGVIVYTSNYNSTRMAELQSAEKTISIGDITKTSTDWPVRFYNVPYGREVAVNISIPNYQPESKMVQLPNDYDGEDYSIAQLMTHNPGWVAFNCYSTYNNQPIAIGTSWTCSYKEISQDTYSTQNGTLNAGGVLCLADIPDNVDVEFIIEINEYLPYTVTRSTLVANTQEEVSTTFPLYITPVHGMVYLNVMDNNESWIPEGTPYTLTYQRAGGFVETQTGVFSKEGPTLFIYNIYNLETYTYTLEVSGYASFTETRVFYQNETYYIRLAKNLPSVTIILQDSNTYEPITNKSGTVRLVQTNTTREQIIDVMTDSAGSIFLNIEQGPFYNLYIKLDGYLEHSRLISSEPSTYTVRLSLDYEAPVSFSASVASSGFKLTRPEVWIDDLTGKVYTYAWDASNPRTLYRHTASDSSKVNGFAFEAYADNPLYAVDGVELSMVPSSNGYYAAIGKNAIYSATIPATAGSSLTWSGGQMLSEALEGSMSEYSFRQIPYFGYAGVRVVAGYPGSAQIVLIKNGVVTKTEVITGFNSQLLADDCKSIVIKGRILYWFSSEGSMVRVDLNTMEYSKVKYTPNSTKNIAVCKINNESALVYAAGYFGVLDYTTGTITMKAAPQITVSYSSRNYTVGFRAYDRNYNDMPCFFTGTFWICAGYIASGTQYVYLFPMQLDFTTMQLTYLGPSVLTPLQVTPVTKSPAAVPGAYGASTISGSTQSDLGYYEKWENRKRYISMWTGGEYLMMPLFY
jgi:hypothetical protein